jgi:hypothetical protein
MGATIAKRNEHAININKEAVKGDLILLLLSI